MDTVPQSKRSEVMSRVRSKDSKPEMIVRRLAFGLGYRYRLHDRRLPGRPDLVFAGRRRIIFVHGCFWHRHTAKSCKLARLPKSRLGFWEPKLEGNRIRDRRIKSELRNLGWEVLTIWECQLTNLASVSKRVRTFLERYEID